MLFGCSFFGNKAHKEIFNEHLINKKGNEENMTDMINYNYLLILNTIKILQSLSNRSIRIYCFVSNFLLQAKSADR